MSPFFNSLFLMVAAVVLTSCASYRLGGTKPEALAHVHSIYVPLAENSTQIPRAAAYVTNGVVDALVADGTYRLGTAKNSDATLEVDFFNVFYGAVRTDNDNRLRPTESSMTIELRWRVLDGENATKVLDSGTSTGRTGLFVDSNLQTAQQSVISDAIQRAATSMIARLSDGFQ